ncbi:MAG: hypothetical protein LUH47_05925, partial [Clostridiales bacterium]|nr:hypothetical protein [Clostridiales bacterium]
MHLKKIQRLTAVALSLIMLSSQAVPAFAADTEQADYTSEVFIEALRVSDEYAEAHSEGVFDFVAGSMNVTEGDRSIEIAVVRKGGTEGEASVDFKIIDVSAKYGEDYVVKVGDGYFKETLEANPEARPLVEAYAEVDEITENEGISEEDIVAVIDTASSDSALTVNSVLAAEGVDLSADNEPEEEPEEIISEDAEEDEGLSETEKAEEELSEESAEEDADEISEDEDSEEVISEDTEETEDTEEISEETEQEDEEAAEADEDAEESEETDSEDSAAVQGKSSGLKAARNAYLGSTSDRENWTETVDNSNSEAIDMATGEIMDWAQEIPGVTTTLTFEDGEYVKVITVEIIDDNLSETDEQVLFFLSNPTAGELGDVYKAYLNISDNDANERLGFEMSSPNVTASRDEGVVEVTVKRTAGTAKFGSVNISTGEVTAKAGVDYEAVTKEVVFPQGVTERKVEIPILKEKATQDGLQFM